MTENAQTTSLGGHIGRTLALALPLTVSRLGLLALVIVDTVMTGRLGADELAYYALAMAFMVPMIMIGAGIAAMDAPSRKPREAVSMSLYHCSLV